MVVEHGGLGNRPPSTFQQRILTASPPADGEDFSLVLGGPLYQLVRKAHLSGDHLALVRRRVVTISLFAWLPLLIMAALSGRAWGTAVKVPFVMDIEVHTRFLVALPLLIVAELVVNQRMRPVVRHFLGRNLIAASSLPRFGEVLASTMRLRNSVVIELALIAFVYLVGVLYVFPQYTALKTATWYAAPVEGGGSRLSVAGWWFAYVSLPLFQFILLRWYFRIFLWIRFLWLVLRCELSLVATHPDRAGGLGFLTDVVLAFAPILAAHGALLAGFIANRILFLGATLPDFKVHIAAMVVYLLLLVLGPLLLLAPHLAAARRLGLAEYGTLAERYVRAFDQKWLRGGAPADEAFLGSADIQSLADLGNSMDVIREMRAIPITRTMVVELAVVTLLPVAPLLLTMVSLEELLKKLLQIVL